MITGIYPKLAQNYLFSLKVDPFLGISRKNSILRQNKRKFDESIFFVRI
jgi:hypothetical protein